MSIPSGVRSVWHFATLLSLPLMAACQGDQLSRPRVLDPAEAFWALRLDHRAVTLSTTSPYDTLTITATPQNVQGTPLLELPAPQYQSTDLEKVGVTAAGVLVAVAPTVAPVQVIATLTDGNLKHQDTVFVMVDPVSVPPRLASLSIHPIPPDTAKVGATAGKGDVTNFPKILPVQAIDSNGGLMPNVLVAFWSSDPETAIMINAWSGNPRNLPPGTVEGLRPGTVTLYASATAFGITKVDTLPFRIGYPVFSQVSVNPVDSNSGRSFFDPPDIKVGAGALVSFLGIEGIDPTDVTFADADLPNAAQAASTWSEFNNPYGSGFGTFSVAFFCSFLPEFDCGGGSGLVTAKGPDAFAAPAVLRVFPIPGTYEYRSIRQGTSGRIVVVSE